MIIENSTFALVLLVWIIIGKGFAGNNKPKLPPPLTGGGEGEGEASTYRKYGNFTPTPTLPRQGGGGNKLPRCLRRGI
jgi:hypothetical protein